MSPAADDALLRAAARAAERRAPGVRPTRTRARGEARAAALGLALAEEAARPFVGRGARARRGAAAPALPARAVVDEVFCLGHAERLEAGGRRSQTQPAGLRVHGEVNRYSRRVVPRWGRSGSRRTGTVARSPLPRPTSTWT